MVPHPVRNLSLMLGLLSVTVLALPGFKPHTVITSDMPFPFPCRVVDIDLDGDQDIVSGSRVAKTIVLYKNDKGAFTPETLHTASKQIAMVETGFFNGDEYPDILFAGRNTGSFGRDAPLHALISRERGDGFEAYSFPATYREFVTIDAGDCDGDGYDDVFASVDYDFLDFGVIHFANDGDGTFHVRDTLERASKRSYIDCADMDNDGNVAMACINGETKAFAKYHYDSTLRRVVRTSLDVLPNTYGDFCLQDLDRDGDRDILFTQRVYLLINDGSYDFSRPPPFPGELGFADVVAAVNMIGDSLPDLLVADNSKRDFRLWENLGLDVGFYPDTIIGTVKRISNIIPADIDNDDDIDVVVTSRGEATVALFTNEGDRSFSETRLAAPGLPYTSCAIPVDFDQNGTMDLVVSSSGNDRVTLFSNDGTQHFTPAILSEAIPTAWTITAADIDGDGDPDILAGTNEFTNNALGWLRNDGANSAVYQDIKTSDSECKHPIPVDLDGDGDLDILGGSTFGGVYWFQNTGEGAFASRQMIVDTSFVDAVAACDFDNDGDMDAISRGGFHERVMFHRNTGTGVFDTTVMLLEGTESEPVWPADIDADGNAELLTVNPTHKDLVMLRWNAGGIDATTLVRIFGEKRELVVADLDADNDSDVVWINDSCTSIGWIENRGDQTFVRHTIATGLPGVRSVRVGDIDGDGDFDLITTRSDDGGLVWYESIPEYTGTAPRTMTRTRSDAELRIVNNSRLHLSLDLPVASRVTLKLHDMAGRRIGRGVDRRYPAGHTVIVHDLATDRPLAAGSYLVAVRYAGGSMIERVVVR